MSHLAHLEDILALTTGLRLLLISHEDMYTVLDYMTGKNVLSLDGAASICVPYLLEQLPWLKEIDARSVNRDNYQPWLEEQIEKYGEYHQIWSIAEHEAVKRAEASHIGFKAITVFFFMNENRRCYSITGTGPVTCLIVVEKGNVYDPDQFYRQFSVSNRTGI